MWFAYMDEAGNTGRNLTDASQTIHLILTLVVDESQVPVLHDHVRTVGHRHCQPHCLAPDFEFHGHALFGGNGYFSGMSPVKRVEIYTDLLEGIQLVGGRTVVRGVFKPGLHARYERPFHPHDIALMFTIESVERMAKAEGSRVLLGSG